MEKQVPVLPGRVLLCTRIEPPKRLTIPFETHKPRPVPCSPLVVKNGSKIRLMMAGAIPTPLSAIKTRKPAEEEAFRRADLRMRTAIVPLRGTASMAFRSKAVMTWRISPAKLLISGALDGYRVFHVIPHIFIRLANIFRTPSTLSWRLTGPDEVLSR